MTSARPRPALPAELDQLHPRPRGAHRADPEPAGQLASWAAANVDDATWHGQAAQLVLDVAQTDVEDVELLLAGLLRWAERSDRYEPAVAEVAQLVWLLDQL